MSVGFQRLRDEPQALRQAAQDKAEDPAVVDAALELDVQRRALSGETDDLRARRKDLSVRVGAAMKAAAPTKATTAKITLPNVSHRTSTQVLASNTWRNSAARNK